MRIATTFIKRIFGRDPEPGAKAIWCLVANLRQMHHHGQEGFGKRRGSQHLPSGAKVYCFMPRRDDGYENIRIIGRHRASQRYVTMVVNSRRLTGWRTQLVSNPRVTRKMAGDWDGNSELLAERLASEMSRRELRRC